MNYNMSTTKYDVLHAFLFLLAIKSGDVWSVLGLGGKGHHLNLNILPKVSFVAENHLICTF